MYKQCRFRRGNTITQGNIREELAIVGKVVKLKENGDGKWSYGWTIVEVFDTPISKEHLDAIENARKQRASTVK
jgi:hypothetical protein